MFRLNRFPFIKLLQLNCQMFLIKCYNNYSKCDALFDRVKYGFFSDISSAI